LLPSSSDSALLARVEKLEKAEGLVVSKPTSKPVVETKPLTKTETEFEPKKLSGSMESAVKEKVSKEPVGDVAKLRKLWPDVIEEVKKKRRLTWSLLSASAQIISLDDKAITIGIVNSGARDSFLRSNSDEILRQAFIDVVGIDRKIEAIVDPSADNSRYSGPRDESPTDEDQLSGTALLAKELGAQIISVEEK
jgi:DNA polymerase-3 subunit gamma/tau